MNHKKKEQNISQNQSSTLDKVQRYKSFTSIIIMITVYSFGMIFYGHSISYLGTF